MPATPPQSSPFAAILSAVAARVATVLAIEPQFVRVVASDRYDITISETLFAYIRAYGPRPFADAGAGRLARTVSRRLRLYLYTRSGSDVFGADIAALMGADPTLTYAAALAQMQASGIMPAQLVAEEIVADALDDFAPLDGGGNMLTVTPLHWADAGDGPPERQPESDAGLIRSSLDFEATYVLAINPAEPAP